MLTVPIPLQVEETKIQPSREHVNVYGLVGCEIEETSSSSETRLFNFFSAEKRTSPSVRAADARIRIATKAVGFVVIESGILIPCGFLAIRKLIGLPIHQRHKLKASLHLRRILNSVHARDGRIQPLFSLGKGSLDQVSRSQIARCGHESNSLRRDAGASGVAHGRPLHPTFGPSSNVQSCNCTGPAKAGTSYLGHALSPTPKSLRLLTAVLLATVLAILIGMAVGHHPGMGPLLVVLLGLLALALRKQETFRGFTFTAWVFTFVAASMVWPQAFGQWLGYDLKALIVPLVQIIMFGMGTKLSGQDFVRVLVMPRPVLIGIVLHFGVMPLTGYAIARTFGFPAEIAAGVVLIGSVSSGVASNVIVYLARGNVALAVTVTACSTLVSPFMTPFLMKTLAAKLVPIDFLAMMIEVFSMVIVPVAAGLIANRILYRSGRGVESPGRVALIAASCFGLAGAVAYVPADYLRSLASLDRGAAVGLTLIGLVALTKLVVSVWLRGPGDWMDKALPFISMAGICVVIAIITARSRDRLLAVGPLLIIAAILHNAVGYLLGYWLARAARLDESACRTIAVEVGMQNGGMATGLAMSVLKSADAALAPAIFGTWMNISGSVLASWWRRRPVLAGEQAAERITAETVVASTREATRQK